MATAIIAAPLTFERANEVLRLDPDTGILYRRSTGRVAGSEPKPYIQVAVDGRMYYAHRLVWLLTYRVWPTLLVDHENTIRHDNRPVNLREATKRQNGENRRRAIGQSGLLGAHWHQQNQNWVSSIMVNRKTKHIGVFQTAQEAHDAYMVVKRQLHEFCPK